MYWYCSKIPVIVKTKKKLSLCSTLAVHWIVTSKNTTVPWIPDIIWTIVYFGMSSAIKLQLTICLYLHSTTEVPGIIRAVGVFLGKITEMGWFGLKLFKLAENTEPK